MCKFEFHRNHYYSTVGTTTLGAENRKMSCYFILRYRYSVYIYTIFISVSHGLLHQAQYKLQFRGSLTDHVGILSAVSGPSFSSAMVNYVNKYRYDRRLSGVEICKIRVELYQCRACCSWKKLGIEQSGNHTDSCVYFQMVCMMKVWSGFKVFHRGVVIVDDTL